MIAGKKQDPSVHPLQIEKDASMGLVFFQLSQANGMDRFDNDLFLSSHGAYFRSGTIK